MKRYWIVVSAVLAVFVAIAGYTATTKGSAGLTFDNDNNLLVTGIAGEGGSAPSRDEDSASSTGNSGSPVLAIQTATPANKADTEGDYEFIQMSAGRLWTSTKIDTALPAGTNNIGDVDVLSLPALPAGTNNIGDVDVLSLVPGTTATSLGKAEDALHTSADVGVMALAVVNSTHTSTLAAGDNDYIPIAADITGKIGIRGTYAEDSTHTSTHLGHQVLGVRVDVPAALADTTSEYIPFMMNSTGGLVTATHPQTAACKTVTVNSQGVANAPVTVDATAGGVAVLAVSTTRCSATIYNESGGDIRCAPTTVTVTASVGALVPVETGVKLGMDSQQAWNCIRVAGDSAVVSVLESTP